MTLGSPQSCVANGHDEKLCKSLCADVKLDSIKEGDSIQLMKCIPNDSVDLVFADEPYGIAASKKPRIEWKDKEWKTINKDDQPWDDICGDEFDQFHQDWLSEAKRVLKPGGALWVTGTYHNIFKLGQEMDRQGFELLNDIVWYKRNAFPNMSANRFSHSHEWVLWAKKPGAKNTFHYEWTKNTDFPKDNLKNPGKQMRSVWDIPTAGNEAVGYPAQKPTKLLERIILSTSNPGDVVLDPFLGSGTTAVVAKENCRRYVGFDLNPVSIEKSSNRLESIESKCKFN